MLSVASADVEAVKGSVLALTGQPRVVGGAEAAFQPEWLTDMMAELNDRDRGTVQRCRAVVRQSILPGIKQS